MRRAFSTKPALFLHRFDLLILLGFFVLLVVFLAVVALAHVSTPVNFPVAVDGDPYSIAAQDGFTPYD